MKDFVIFYQYIFKFEDGEIIIDPFLVDYVKSHLNERRYLHSLSVAKLAYNIAISNKLENPIKYYFTGFIHDIGKYIDEEDSLKIMKEYYSQYLDLPKYAFHAFIGAYLLKNELKIDDKEIIDAIIYHTTGNKELSPLAMIIFASDKMEPTRNYDSSNMIEMMLKDYRSGFKEVVKEVEIFLKDKEEENNRLSEMMYEYYLK